MVHSLYDSPCGVYDVTENARRAWVMGRKVPGHNEAGRNTATVPAVGKNLRQTFCSKLQPTREVIILPLWLIRQLRT